MLQLQCGCLYFVSKTTLFTVDPPKVTEHPDSQSVPIGGEIIFKVEARGDDLIFQWQKNGTNLKNGRNCSGTDTNTLNIRQVKKSDAGCYRCLVKNEIKKNGILSEEAELSVCKYILSEYSYEIIVYPSITFL